MVGSLRAVTALVVAAAVTAASASSVPTCGEGNPCPSSAPCCSQYGQCGVGAYCLGGCDPMYSYNLDACMPAPICSSADYKLTSLDDIVPNTEYLGDPSKGNWVSSGTPVAYQDQGVLLTMAPNTVGTLLTSTRYVWYGKISATLTTSQGAGVVTAFIMLSDVKDEIDFEFVGVDLEHAQSNYYFQGINDFDNGYNLSVSNTVENTHTYTFDWQPDTLTWAIDGVVLRTLNRNTTYNSTSGQYHYPQTPARVELSLWPAGLSSNAQGTIDWAGGEISWDSPYMQNGYYYAMFSDVNVECYDPPSGYNNDGTKAYVYTTTAGTNDTVQTVNNNTILSSFYASGDNPKYNPDASSSASGTKTATSSGSAAATSDLQTVPGVSGGGVRGDGSSDSSSGDTSSASGSASASSAASTSSSSSGGGFSQGMSGTGGTNDGSKVVAGSLVALVAFFAAAMML